MYENNFIGNNLKKFRKSINFTIDELSKMIDSSAGYISDIENGKSMPSIPKLISICSAIGITLKEFFDDGSEPMVLTPELKELMKSARDLSPEQISQLTLFIKTIK